MPAWVPTFLVVIACAVLMWAGLEKIRSPSSLAASIQALGGPPRFATIAAVIVPVAELATVTFVVAGVSPYLPAALFAVLGVAFATAGARAMQSRAEVACACFGTSERRLGWPQLAGLPLWLLAAWSVIHMPAFGLRERLGCAAAAIVLLTAGRAFSAVRLGAAARSDRRAFAGD